VPIPLEPALRKVNLRSVSSRISHHVRVTDQAKAEAQPNPLGCHPVQKRHTIALIVPLESPVTDLIMSAAATSADAKGKGKATTENDPSLSSTGKDLKGKGKAKLDANVSSVGIEMSNLKLDLNTINMIRDHEKHGGIPREIMGLEHANAPFGFITRADIIGMYFYSRLDAAPFLQYLS